MSKERLIDAERLKADLRGLYEFAGWGEREVHFSLADMDCNIDMEDSVEAEPVRHGYWTRIVKQGYAQDWFCSVCGETGRGDYAWCPRCGARMDKETEE